MYCAALQDRLNFAALGMSSSGAWGTAAGVITTVGGPVVPCMITVGSQKRSISPSLRIRQLEEDVEKLLHHALVRDT